MRFGETTKQVGFDFSNLGLAFLPNCLWVVKGDGLGTAACFGACFLIMLYSFIWSCEQAGGSPRPAQEWVLMYSCYWL
jgi:hypothetical protein